ncbi:MAG: hypothetical protein OEV64_10505 [Desulfobulbaceae bacterium]|nr:hypothetical protein [Desulfobulbaceae bacterium]
MSNERQSNRTTVILFVFFLFLWITGIALDEPLRVIEQACAICLGCIGIG